MSDNKKLVVLGDKSFIVDVIGPNPFIDGSFYVRYPDGATDSFKPRFLKEIPEDIAALTETLRLKEDECKRLAQDKDELLSVLTDISNMCIGEIAMGRSVDAQSVGEMIFAATGLTNPELNEREKHK